MSTLPAISNLKFRQTRPVRILQFGQGNFLRAFVDDFVETLNNETDFNGNIVIVKPTARGNLDTFKKQHNQYTVLIRGLSSGEIINEAKKITSIDDCISPYTEYQQYIQYAKSPTLRFIISNTTEAGIIYADTDTLSMTPPDSFPGKLTQFLYQRFLHFDGDLSKGLIILPTELIDHNGTQLRDIIFRLAEKWELPDAFLHWLNEACTFTNTLVDRIVSGFPKENAEELFRQLGYIDELLVTAEPFGLWVIEGDASIQQELPIHKTSLPIVFTDDYQPYKERKVRILNGAHTASALLAFSCGKTYVKDMLDDDLLTTYIHTILFDEVIPCLSLPKHEAVQFANDVLERFANPFLNHALLSISLNSISKWKARCLPSLNDYEKQFCSLPKCLLFSLAALLYFYHYGDGSYEIKDDDFVLAFFAEHKGCTNEKLVEDFLSKNEFHGLQTAQQAEAKEILIKSLDSMCTVGPYETLKEFLHGKIY